MPQYTVKDETGRTVTFEWHGDAPPTDADLEEVFSAATPVSSHQSTPAPDEPRTWTDTAVDALPMLGGALGGLVGAAGGPPGAVAGAMVGGAGGEGYRRAIQGLRGKRPEAAKETVSDTLRGVSNEGLIQGAWEAGGGIVGAGLKRGGKALYRGLLKPSKAIREDFKIMGPNGKMISGGDAVVQTLMDEGVTISGKGLDKATGKLAASRDAALKMVDDAAPTSTYVKPSEVMGEFGDVVKELRNRINAGQASELAKVGERGKRLMKVLGGSRGMDASGAQVAKETAQEAAYGGRRMVERGGSKQLSADDLLDAATARGFKKAVESRVPGVAAQNQRTQALLGAKRAVQDAVEGRANNMAVGGARDIIAAGTGAAVGGPAGLATGLVSRVLASPRAGSALGIALNRTGKKVPIDELIRALDALVRESGRE